ncbi:MAG: MATE family efflux transporter [Cyclobacteriaceae bacterium]|nr:MATE family efflux transporter [Cyclobacteriaceae bacterium]UYN87787.1 MAG: MATE family efflux transporter [Cyclobacteriaceae bacterium]
MSFFTKAISIFRLFKQALKGEEQSYTSGSIDKAIFMLSIPMILEMSMESLFAVVDAFYVSRLGVDALATVSLTESVLTLVYSLAIGLSMGATAMVARRVGEGDIPAAAKAGVQAIYLAIGISIAISIVGLFFAENILGLMGASESVIASGSGYTRWMLGGNITVMLIFLINAIFRGAGDASLAMRVLILSNALNIILDPIFIFGFGPIPAFGVEGAAIATTIGRGIGVLYQISHLIYGKGLIKIHRQNLPIDFGLIGRLIKVSAGGTGQFIIASASWIFLVRIVSTFGSEALAGYTIAIRVIVFAILPAWGMANAAATLVGQNLGAGQPERAEQSVWRTGFFNMLFMAFITVTFLTLAKPIVELFTTEVVVLANATQCLQIVAIGYIFYAYGMVVAQSFNGAGDTRTPTILNFFAFWMFQIPLAYALAILLNMGPKGVYVAIVVAESALAVVGILIFRRGKWKTVKV